MRSLVKVIVTGRTLQVEIEFTTYLDPDTAFCPEASKRRCSWPMAVRLEAGGDSGVTAEPAGVRV